MNRTFTVTDEVGLHARPASLLAQTASKYKNDITIEYKGRKLTLKSIMIVMSLGIPYGDSFVIEATGEGEKEILDELEQLLKKHNVI